MSVTVRTATADDANSVYEMICELARYEREESSVKVKLPELREQLGNSEPPFKCLLAEHNGSPSGFALYFYGYSTWEGKRTLYLEDLYVRPQFRGEKIGIALMRELAQIAQLQNCNRFEWSVLNWNELAINFYEKIGAQPLSAWTRYRMDAATIAAFTSV